MEKLLLVLNKIEERLAMLEPRRDLTEKVEDKEVEDEDIKVERIKDEEITDRKPAIEETTSPTDMGPKTMSPEEIRLSGNRSYMSPERRLGVIEIAFRAEAARDPDFVEQKETPRLQANGAPLHELWTEYLGYAWQIPPDGRVGLSFDESELSGARDDELPGILGMFRDWNYGIGKDCFTITDFDKNGLKLEYKFPSMYHDTSPMVCNELSMEERFSERETVERLAFDFSDCHVESKGAQQEVPFGTAKAQWRRYM